MSGYVFDKVYAGAYDALYLFGVLLAFVTRVVMPTEESDTLLRNSGDIPGAAICKHVLHGVRLPPLKEQEVTRRE